MTRLPTPLVSVEWLSQSLDAPNLLLLDATMLPPAPGQASYQPRVQIAATRRFDFDQQICDQTAAYPHMLPTPEQFQQQVRALGVNRDSQIVIYDALGLFSAARGWWMFRAMGHNQVAVLDGGLPAWRQAGLPVAPWQETRAEMGDFIANPRPGLFCDAVRVEASLQNPDCKVLDARGAARFAGSAPEPRAGVRAGHMPGAINLPYAELLEDGKLKPVDELSKRLAEIAGQQQQLIFSCGSGVTACILALAAELCGYSHLCVYDGSWAEWGARAELPVVK